MRHVVEVTIQAVITLRGKVEADSPAKARKLATAEAKRLAVEFTERPVLEGKWPEVLGGATVQAKVAKGAEVSIELEA